MPDHHKRLTSFVSYSDNGGQMTAVQTLHTALVASNRGDCERAVNRVKRWGAVRRGVSLSQNLLTFDTIIKVETNTKLFSVSDRQLIFIFSCTELRQSMQFHLSTTYIEATTTAR